MPLLNKEAGSINELRQQAHDLGLVLGDDVIDAGVNFTDTMDQMKRSVTAVMTQIGAKVMPVFTTFANWILAHMPQIQKIFSVAFNIMSVVVDAVINTVMRLIGWFGDVYTISKDKLGPTIDKLRDAWNNLKKALDPIITAFRTLFDRIKSVIAPATSATSTVKALDVILKAVGITINIVAGIVNGFTTVLFTVITTIQNVVNSVISFKNTVTEVFANVKNTIANTINAIKGMFNFTWKLPDIKMPHFNISPNGWKFGDLLKGTIPTLGINWYAKGYDEAQVLEKPTIFGQNNGQLLAGGEKGNEVVSGEAHLIELINKTVSKSLDDKLGNSIDAIAKLLQNYLPECANAQLVLDSGAIVGGLAPAMDKKLGSIVVQKKRGGATW